jgi:hypothetical protein
MTLVGRLRLRCDTASSMLERVAPSVLVSAVLAASLAACTAGGPRRVQYGNATMTVGATVRIGARGALELLTDCKVGAVYFFDTHAERGREPCRPGQVPIGAGEIVVTTPWGTTSRGPVTVGLSVVPIDWNAVPFDPLASNASERLATPWQIAVSSEWEPREWRPTREDLARLVASFAEATGTETALVRGGPPPALAVTELSATPDLRAGATAELSLTIENRGEGSAYRVVVTTRSSLDSLHGLRFAFGALAPGERETRRLQVRIDGQTTDPSAMLVLVFAEGNDVEPANHSQRLAVLPPVLEPRLTIDCGARARMAESRLAVDAAEPVRLVCVVSNTGGIARDVTLEVQLAGGDATTLGPQDIATDDAHAFDLRVELPRDARLDAELALVVTARERGFGRSASATLTLVVDRARVCPRGTLSRPAYQAKRAELVKARDAGALTDAELDAYDAELVGCLE